MGNVLSTMADCSIVHWARLAKRARGFICWRSEMDRPKILKETRRCHSVQKLLFPFTPGPPKCGQNGPSMDIHWGIRVRLTDKVLRVCCSLGQAGEPMIW